MTVKMITFKEKLKMFMLVRTKNNSIGKKITVCGICGP
jgi:hypothetical protein